MPIYAYKCAECGHPMEMIQRVSDPLLTDCPNCGKPALVKQVTAAGFQLKGGGWYVTDFRDSGKKKEAKPKTEEAASDSKSETADTKAVTPSDAKTESKPAESKTETKTESKPAPSSTPPPPSKSGAG